MRDWPDVISPRYPVAVFLDRDGTINVDTHFPHRLNDLKLLPGALEGVAAIAALPVHVIVISNQAGIALGMYGREAMTQFNSELRVQIERYDGRIDAFYYCPHLEPKHLGAGIRACECSKPAPGLLLEAARDFGLSLPHSVFVGDKPSDMQAGQAAGCVTIFLGTSNSRETRADHYARDLREVASLVSRKILPAAATAPRVARSAG